MYKTTLGDACYKGHVYIHHWPLSCLVVGYSGLVQPHEAEEVSMT